MQIRYGGILLLVVVFISFLVYFGLLPIMYTPLQILELLFMGWIIIEVAFYGLFRSQLRNMQWLSTPPVVLQPQRRRIFDQVLRALSVETDKDAKHLPTFISGWFFGAPAEKVWRGNIAQFLAWSLWYRFPAALDEEEREELEGYIRELEEIQGSQFKEGFNHEVKAIRLSLDQLNALHRPLFVYAIVKGMDWAASHVLRLAGYELRCIGGFNYWYRSAAPGSPPRYPVVFVHGLGHGLVYYLELLGALRGERPLFLLELRYVSSRVWEHIPSVKRTVEAVHTILTENNFTRAIFIGHSYGSIAVSWCIKYKPEMVQSAMLIDPISLLLCLPKVAHNFVYKEPQTAFQWIRYVFLSRELGISRVMSRAFWWQSNALFLDDVPCFPRTAKAETANSRDLTRLRDLKPCTRPACCVRQLVAKETELELWTVVEEDHDGKEKGAPEEQQKNERRRSSRLKTEGSLRDFTLWKTALEVLEAPDKGGASACLTVDYNDPPLALRKRDRQLTAISNRHLRERASPAHWTPKDGPPPALIPPFAPASLAGPRTLSTLPFFREQAPLDASLHKQKTGCFGDLTDEGMAEKEKEKKRESLKPLPSEVLLFNEDSQEAEEECDCERMKLAIVLSESDSLVPSPEILNHFRLYRDSLGRGRVRALFFQGHEHAQFLTDDAARDEVLGLLPWLDADS
uniref:AB hydrolase-1 domain-containing protein n=1 Tax=Chromera velia CCMP2878 TaxID=1169474 RepID=A0A0G4HL36_9ALVE|eukprot:Cvel_28662.t1-p1 / transcript=Cvel_28662.t1 / gene=Cvel_28662 / organism=Chromera_velia_CCMP2878 / gene_product=hypothetical protein / transcript_product=hypothetical protein / location=Cvel_scaffold3794:8216-10956(-) / protein_length=684 / sequence_SO=supercontig / SO=protein_coding / is_pseudo=false